VDLDDGGGFRGVEATIAAKSIDTGVGQRDDHLRSTDFFDVERFPSIVFQSTRVERLAEGRYRVDGHLTMHGHTQPVTFEVEAAEPVRDPWGNQRVAASVTGKLNRKAWGLTWNQLLELGALMVGEDVTFTFDVEAVAPQPATV
jgi:polyisoprenoid-binding protein YceI